MELDERYLFAIDHPVDPRDQAAIIRLVREEGSPIRGHHTPRHARPFWTWQGLAEPDPKTIPPSGSRWLEARAKTGPTLSGWGYYARLDPAVKWSWIDNGSAAIVRRILEPVLPLYRRLTKVNVILQVPGEAVNAHRDLVHGNMYDLENPFHWRSGSQRLRYEGEPWLSNVAAIHSASHEDNGYLCLKIPLSERPDDTGSPFVLRGDKRYHYSSRGRLFFLNEVEILHGADATTFWRGVVFVNGIFDMDAVRRLHKIPIDVR